MFKKIIILSFVFITLFYFNINVISAYDYINSESESSVNGMITEIYDAKQQYVDLAGEDEIPEIINVPDSDSYWWPIGSAETTVGANGKLFATGDPIKAKITSYFGSKEKFRIEGHGALDIASGNGVNVDNIIASKSGRVVYPTKASQTAYRDNGNLNNSDGKGYGNHIIIEHSDGNFTLYGHLAQNSITVMAGDVVEQGQVIAKLGHSGRSTGPHLHFEVRKGVNSRDYREDPLNYVDPKNPRPISYGSGNNFSLTNTTLSKEEFISKMKDYCARSGKKGFCDNFANKADEIYTASLANKVNPELVVVTAGTEQNWTLSAACSYTNNYWGIGITNGNGCNSGAKYSSITEGIAGYAKIIQSYSSTGSYANSITKVYNERVSAGCTQGGYGLPGTLEGWQSIYSFIGSYRYNPGSSGGGGCYYLNRMYNNTYCNTHVTCSDYTFNNSHDKNTCSADSATTICEQSDYTAYQLKNKAQIRYDIFGL